jgi:hypothetical protein
LAPSPSDARAGAGISRLMAAGPPLADTPDKSTPATLKCRVRNARALGTLDAMPREFPRETAATRSEPLFKFRAFDRDRDVDPEWQGYAASFLRDGLVYAASTLDLNDPWEGRLSFRIPDADKDPAHAKTFVESFCAQHPEETRPRAAEWIREQGFESVVRDMQLETWRSSQKRGLYSMAGTAVSPLLWSYYANGHRGFCWVLDPHVLPLRAATRVTYQSEYPEIDWAHWQEMDLLGQSALTKGLMWAHEEEYRLLVPERSAPELFPIVAHNGRGPAPRGRYLRLPPEAVTGVILGTYMDPQDAADLLGLVEAFGRNIQVHTSRVHLRQYEMSVATAQEEDLKMLAKAAAKQRAGKR